MLKTNEEQRQGVGVIVGRFQVPELTAGHLDLIESVAQRHVAVMIVLGLAAIRASKNNPLDFECRRAMIAAKFPQIKVMYINDNPDDEVWVKTLDRLIESNTPPGAKPTLYGSRDSFLRIYRKHGNRLPNADLEPDKIVSGTRVREHVALETKTSEDFRKGAIWATQQQYDKVFSTVDVVPYRLDDRGCIAKILMAQKREDGGKLRFIGGFVQPDGDDHGRGDYMESNAARELAEEAHLELVSYNYLGTFRVDDWRYAGERDKIVTMLFAGEARDTQPRPDDDIDALEWVGVHNLGGYDFITTKVVGFHQKLANSVMRWINVQNNRTPVNC